MEQNKDDSRGVTKRPKGQKGSVSAQKKVETSLASAIVAVPRSLSAKVVRQIFPIHDQEALKKLQNDWVKQFLKRQPIGKIRH